MASTLPYEERPRKTKLIDHQQAGAGIVADSAPEQEWQETLDKASGILLAAEKNLRCGWPL